MINKTEFAKRLTDLRTKCRLSQNKLAEMLFISGQAISKWETGNSLPDIELLVPLAQILGVTVDTLLNSGESIMSESLAGYDISDTDISILTAMTDTLSREYLYKTAKYIEHGKLQYTISVNLKSEINNTTEAYQRDIDMVSMPIESLKPISRQLANLTMQAINKSYNPVQDIVCYMKCPECGKDLNYMKNSSEEYLTCGNHRYEVSEGVVDFKSLEIQGFTWSSWIRRYEDYKNNYTQSHNEEPSDRYKSYLAEMRKDKPQIILDIGSGMMDWASKMIRLIDWDCVLVLTDLSHRLLKYDKRCVDEELSNPKVKVVYLACDVKNLPFRDGVIDCITSSGGYDCISYGQYDKAFIESVRVLKQNHKVITSLSCITDRNTDGNKKWLALIEEEANHGQLMREVYNMIHDVGEWHEILPTYGFTSHTLTMESPEIPPPDTDVFPYDCMVDRWMGLASVIAVK